MRKWLILLTLPALLLGAISSHAQCLTITLTEADVSCYGSNDGQVIVTVNSGVAPFTYELFFFQPGFGSTKLGEVNTAGLSVTFKKGNGSLSQPGAEAFGIPANAFVAPGSQYQVTVSASGGGGLICETKSASTVVNEPSQLTASVNSITPACTPGTGAIDLNVGGGTPGYTFVWTGPSAIGNIEDPININGGTYSVVITDNAGCQNTTLSSIVVPVPTIANAGADQDVCLDNTSLLANSVQATETGTWSVIAGTGVFGNINNPGTTVNGLSYGANQFRWTITDNNAFCPPTSDDVVINRFVEPTVSAGGDQTICSGTVTTLAGSSVGGSATTGTWSIVVQPGGGNGVLSVTVPTGTPATVTFTATKAGTYTLRLTTDDPAGPCTPVSDDVDIVVDQAATANAGADKALCSGTVYALAGSSVGGSATTGAWSIFSQPGAGDGILSSGSQTATPSTVTFKATFAGVYTLRLTSNNPPNTCPPATDDVVITINPAATVNAGPDASICSGTLHTLSTSSIGGSATMGAWSIVSQPAGGNGMLSSTALTATPANVTFTATVVGIYTLKLTTNNPAGPCPAVSDNIKLTVDQAPTVNAGPDKTNCAGTVYALAGSSVGGSASTGAWSIVNQPGGGDGFLSSVVQTATPSTVTFKATVAGIYTLRLTTNVPPNSCPAVTDDVLITINPPATVAAGPDQSICSGTIYALAGSSVGGSAATAAWSIVSQPGGGNGMLSSTLLTGTPSNITFTATVIGAYRLRLTTNNPAGPCGLVTDDVDITVDAVTTANAGADKTICSGTVSTLTGSSVGGSATTGAWSIVTQPVGGNGILSSVAQTATPSTVTFTATVAGNYFLRLTSNSPNTCPAATDDVKITVNPKATVNAGPDQAICAASVYALAGSSIGGSASTGAWSIVTQPGGGDGMLSSTLQIANPSSVTFTATVTGIYKLRLTTNNPAGPCGTVNDDVDITVQQAATVNAGADQSICPGDIYTMAGSSFGGSATTAAWSIFSQPVGGDGGFSTMAQTMSPATVNFSASTLGIYTLRLTTDDPAGACAAVTDDVIITVTPPATASAGGDQTICGGTTYPLAGSGVGGSASTGAWSIFNQPGGGDGMLSSTAQTATPSSETFTATVPGLYTLRLTTDDPSGTCNATSDDVDITVDLAAIADAGTDQYICAGDVYTLAGTSFSGSASSAGWSIFSQPGLGDGFLSSTAQTATPQTVTFTASVPGDYILELTTDDPTGVCTPGTDDVTITVPGAPSAPTVFACVNNPAPALTASTSYLNVAGFNWYTDIALTNQVFSGASYTPAGTELDMSAVDTTVFYVTIKFISGCETIAQPDTVIVTDHATVAVSDTTICEFGGQVDLTTLVNTATPPGGMFIFTGSGITGNMFDPTGLTGANTIDIGYALGTCTDNQPSIITVVDVASIVLPSTATDVCDSGGTVDLSTMVSATPLGGAFTFTGTNVTGSSFDPSGLSGIQDITVDYVSNGCNASATLQISVTANAIITPNDGQLCQSSGVVDLNGFVTASPSGGVFTFTGTGVSGTTFDPTGLTGAIDISVDYSIGGCIAPSTTLTMTVLDPTDPICTGIVNCGPFTITASNTTPSCGLQNDGVIKLLITGGTPGYFVTLTDSASFLQVIAGNGPQFTFTGLPPAIYHYQILDSFGTSCIYSDTLQLPVTVTAVANPASFMDAVCFNQPDGSAIINASGSSTGKYFYSIDDAIWTQFTPGSPITVLPPNGTYLIFVGESISDACRDSVSVTINNLATAALVAAVGELKKSVPLPEQPTGSMQLLGFGGGEAPYQVRIVLDSASVIGQSFSSTFETVVPNMSGALEKIYEGLPAGSYDITVEDDLGCDLSLTAIVPLDIDLFIPNIFTPNGDSFNDTFFIRNLPSPGARLVITNRWGKEVYTSNDYKNDWNGGPLPDGMYFYRISASGTVKTGWVEILRGKKGE